MDTQLKKTALNELPGSTGEPLAGHIVVIGGHPNPESYGEALLSRYVAAAESAGATVHVHRVSQMQFDPVLHHGYAKIQPLEPDLRTLQRDIERAAHVAVFTPLWWGGVPAGLKGLFDRAFLPQWAFRVPDSGLPIRLLKGRSARMVLTMDSPRWWYWGMYRGSAHGALVQATLKFVGLKPVKITPLYGVGHATATQRQRWLAKLEAIGKQDAARARATGRRLQATDDADQVTPAALKAPRT